MHPETSTEAATLAWYDAHAAARAERYDALEPHALAQLLERWIPAGARVLEFGCGSGRDARALAARGALVTATDGSAAMLAEARRRSRGLSERIRFCPLAFPAADPKAQARALMADANGGRPFDAFVAVGLLQHLERASLFQAARLMEAAASPSAVIVLSVPTAHPEDPIGPAPARTFRTRPAESYADLFERFGFSLVEKSRTEAAGLPESRTPWMNLVFLRRAERPAARANLTGIIERDRKRSTYKFALLRAVCELNIANPNCVRFREPMDAARLPAALRERVDDDAWAAVPFGLVVEKTIEYYWSILAGEVRPTDPRPAPRQIHRGQELKFKSSLLAFMRRWAGDWEAFRADWHRGRLLLCDAAEARELWNALCREVGKTLIKGPVCYSGNSLPGGGERGMNWRVFRTSLRTIPRRADAALPERLSESFGELLMPAAMWLELTGAAPWFRDSILIGWAKLSAEFDAAEGAPGGFGRALEALLPEEPARSTALAAACYRPLAAAGRLRCLWSGRALSPSSLAVDHLIPWSRIHSNDLWNLVPSSAEVNLRKSDAVPTVECLERRADALFGAWRLLESKEPRLFRSEAERALMGRPLGERGWETPLFDALGETLESVARQMSARRWTGEALL